MGGGELHVLLFHHLDLHTLDVFLETQCVCVYIQNIHVCMQIHTQHIIILVFYHICYIIFQIIGNVREFFYYNA